MHSSVLRSSLTGPKWRCVYCGTIHKSFIITVLPQPWLTLCHHDNHCVSLYFQASRTGLSQILLLYSWSSECWFDGWMKGTPRRAASDLDRNIKKKKWFLLPSSTALFQAYRWRCLISISMTNGSTPRRKGVESYPEGKANGRALLQSQHW